MSHEQVDTRVTAYVFGELSADETAAFERELEQSGQLQDEVAAIRDAVGVLKSELSAQASPMNESHVREVRRSIRTSATTSQESESPIAPPVAVQTERDERIARHRLTVAALAASVLILFGLAYPRLFPKQTVTMNEPTLGGVGDTALGTVKELPTLVASFNELVNQGRYDEADRIVDQVSQIEPDHPIEVTMRNATRMGRQAAVGAAGVGNQVSPTTDADTPAPADSQLPIVSLEMQDAAGARAAAPASSNQNAVAAATAEGGDPSTSPPPASNGLDVMEEEESIADYAIADLDLGGAQPSPSQPPSAELDDMDMMMGMGGMGMAGGGIAKAKRQRRARGAGVDEMDMMGMDLEMMVDDVGVWADAGLGFGNRAAGDRFEPIEDNPFRDARQSPLSTFSIDVDTASYTKVRALLNRDTLPRPDAVRIEEMLNYFNYDYGTPQDDQPFTASMEIAACPWNQKHRLARIGIQGKMIETERPSSNLVFLLDVSGSMDEPDKLPLMIEGMKMLTDQLTENDKVSIVVYAGAAGLVLDATRGDRKQRIIEALDLLRAGGSTNGGQGITLAYQLARDNFIVGGTNRVILCTDGDFNVGLTGDDELIRLAQKNAKSDIFLSVLGFGIGNHNDAMMEQISNKGNGNYAFIDSRNEAEKVLIEELGSTLVTIAKDVKIQIEFNPKHVSSYRLIGYENRMLAAEDFNDDKKDAGEIGAGHTVTALYEIVPAEVDDVEIPPVDKLRYQIRSKLSEKADSGESLVLKLRYKLPNRDESTLVELTVNDNGKRFSQTDRDFKFAASVAAFGMLLRNSPYKGEATFDNVFRMARQGAKGDDFGYRTEFVSLVAKARQLRGE